MMVVLAGIATTLLAASEIVAIAPVQHAKRVRVILIWCAIPVLVIFAATWLVHIRGVLETAR